MGAAQGGPNRPLGRAQVSPPAPRGLPRSTGEYRAWRARTPGSEAPEAAGGGGQSGATLSPSAETSLRLGLFFQTLQEGAQAAQHRLARLTAGVRGPRDCRAEVSRRNQDKVQVVKDREAGRRGEGGAGPSP